MNLWKHDDKYEHIVMPSSRKIVVRFDEAPESSIRHLEKKALKPLSAMILASVPRHKIIKVNVKLLLSSTMTMFDWHSFNDKASEFRKHIGSAIGGKTIGDWVIKAKDRQDQASITFELEIFYQE